MTLITRGAPAGAAARSSLEAASEGSAMASRVGNGAPLIHSHPWEPAEASFAASMSLNGE